MSVPDVDKKDTQNSMRIQHDVCEAFGETTRADQIVV